MFTATALVVCALVPGLFARWSSARLLDRLEDPLLPDLLIVHARRVGSVVGVVIGVGSLLASSFLPVLVLLTWVSVLAGGFRARKAVFDESWRFFSYLEHSLRFWLGLLGSFVLIASIPWAMSIAGDTAGIALGAVACLWALEAPRVFRTLVRARPLEGPEVEELAPLFRRVLEKAKCGRPALFVAGAPGGSWVNAFALPAVRRPGVLFTRGILAALTPEEIAAIFAHEVAHLEHFTPRKVALGRALLLVLVALPIFLWGGPSAEFLRGWEWIWPLSFFIAIAVRAGRSRSHEAESDRRALELGADPDAFVSGLTKLHSLNRLSRRWDAAYESLSTHPSLARRIRAIRAVSGKHSPGELESIFFAGDGSDRAVVFDSMRVHWLRGLPEDRVDLLALSEERRSYRYQDVVELRLQGHRGLVLKDSAGQTAQLAVSAEDVSRLEEVLDRVDGLFADAPSPSAAPTERLWSLVVGLLGLIPSISWVAAAIAAAAFVRPSRAALLAVGASGLATAIAIPYPWWRSAAIALAGLACVLLSLRKRGVREGRSETLVFALVPMAFVLLSSLGAVGAVFSSLPAIRLSFWANETPSALVGLVVAGTVLASRKQAAARFGAALAMVAALGLGFLRSSSFLESIGGDLFGAPGEAIPVREASLRVLREVTIPGGASRLVLSPRGGSFAVSLAAAENAGESEYVIEAGPGRLSSMRALALEYVDEDRILVLERNGDRATLKARELGGESAVVAPELPLLAGADLDADPSGTWQLTGYDWIAGAFVVIRGSVDAEAPPREIRFSSGEDGSTVLAVSPEAGALVARYDIPESPVLALAASPRLGMALSLEEASGSGATLGESILSPQCFGRPSSERDEAGFYCIAADSRRTGFFSLTEGASSFEPLGFVSGVFYGREVGPGGRIVLNRWDDEPLLVDLERRSALRPRDADLRGSLLAWRGEILAAARVSLEGDETKVSLYTVRE